MNQQEVKVKTSIGTKLISIIGLTVITALIPMIFFASYFFTHDVELRIIENNHSRARIIASKVTTDFNAILKVSNLISSYLITDQAISDVDIAILEKKFFFNDRDLVYIGSALKEGSSLKMKNSLFNNRFSRDYSLTRSHIEENLVERGKLFDDCFNLHHVIVNISQGLQHPMIAIGVPMNSTEDTPHPHIVIICMSMMNYVDALRTEGLIKTTLVDNSGHVLAADDINMILSETDLSSLPIVEMMLKSPIDNGQSRYTIGMGTEYLASFKKIPFGGIGIITSVESEKAFQAVKTILYRNMLILIIVLCAAVIIGYFFSKTLTRPIYRLLNVIKRVKDGDFSYQITKMPNDEMGVLMHSFNLMNRGLAERENIKSAFGKFVNKEIAERVMNEEIKLGGERTEVSVFFSDIRSFTSMSEQMDPEDVVSFLNEYMTEMVACVNQTQGVVDKFIGDAIMALWGTPVARENDTENAVQCALLMRTSLIKFNKRRKSKSLPPIHIGCGINTGTVLAGQIGSQDRMEYTVIGDNVNLASRIESLNKPFGTDILVSDGTYEQVKDIFAAEKMKPIRVKGKANPIQIWAILGRIDDPDRPTSVAQLRSLLGITPDKKVVYDSSGEEKKYASTGKKKNVKKVKKSVKKAK